MKITVLGLGHLGCVTAACCSRHFEVVGLDFDAAAVAALRAGRAPLLEPGLDDLIADNIEERRLDFSSNAILACRDADVLWVTCNVPVNDEAEAASVVDRVRQVLPNLSPGVLVLISSPLPIGTCANLQREFPQFRFASSPANLRPGTALDAFEKAERVIVGIRDDEKKPLIERLFDPFTDCVIFMRTESAEMVKHTLTS